MPESAADRAAMADAPVSRASRRSGPPGVCMFGLFGLGNLGNDGSLETMVGFLRAARPDIRISCISVDPAKVAAAHRIDTVPISWPGFQHRTLDALDRLTFRLPGRIANWSRAVRHLRQFDALMVPGSATLSDYRASPFGLPYAVFRWTAAARLAGVGAWFISTGAGPIAHRISRSMVTWSARLATYRSFRDTKSKHFIGALGVDTSEDRLTADLVFGLPTPPAPAERPIRAGAAIGVGLMDYNGWQGHTEPSEVIYETYLGKMCRFVRRLLDRGYTVRLLIGEHADERAVIDLRRILETQALEAGQAPIPPERLVFDRPESLHDLMRQMQTLDIVVATRFHNAVCALKVAKPTLSVGYETKNDELLRRAGLGAFLHHIDHFDPDVLLDDCETVLRGRHEYAAAIEALLPVLAAEVDRQRRDVLQMLGLTPA